MDKTVVAVFESESQADAAASALKDRCEDGVLLMYALAVIADDGGRISVTDFMSDQDLSDSVVGLATRNLIDVLAAAFSSIGCANSDAREGDWMKMANAGVDAVFVDEVTRRLTPGRAAVVAEIEEQMATAVDAMLEYRGGMVLGFVRGEIMEAQVARELDMLRDEVQTVERQLARAPNGSQAQLRLKLDQARARFQATKNRAGHYAAAIKREAEAKIVLLQERAAAASGWRKARLEGLANKVRNDYVNRATKLNLAGQSPRNVLAVCCLMSILE
jgi:hypothetical protein